MPRPKKDAEREQRIEDEIIVDAYGSEEQAVGWYYYLQDNLLFPFTASCIGEMETSPLRKDDEVKVIGMASEDSCQHDMFVKVRWEGRGLAVPLSQLNVSAEADEDTREAIGDWHYWIDQGYMLLRTRPHPIKTNKHSLFSAYSAISARGNSPEIT